MRIKVLITFVLKLIIIHIKILVGIFLGPATHWIYKLLLIILAMHVEVNISLHYMGCVFADNC